MIPVADESFLTALPVRELFADSTYQRELDENRCRRMAKAWDPRLVGVCDVSDRGPGDQITDRPRYAIINGQHRWRAATLLDPAMSLVCTVHQGLTVEDEAKLFFDIDRSTKALSTWDRWRSRRGAGDKTVLRIEMLCRNIGAPVSNVGGAYVIKSTTTLEQMFRIDEYTMTATIELAVDVWPNDNAGLQGGLLRGLFPVVRSCDDTDSLNRLTGALSEIVPAQIHARALGRRDQFTSGQFWTLISRVVVDLYNTHRAPGPRLRIEDVLKAGVQ